MKAFYSLAAEAWNHSYGSKQCYVDSPGAVEELSSDKPQTVYLH